jgi:hypothetical protein
MDSSQASRIVLPHLASVNVYGPGGAWSWLSSAARSYRRGAGVVQACVIRRPQRRSVARSQATGNAGPVAEE